MIQLTLFLILALTASCVVGFTANTHRFATIVMPSPTARISAAASFTSTIDNSLKIRTGPSRWMAEMEDDASIEESDESPSRLQRMKRILFPPKPDDGLTFKQRLGKAGLSVLLSYGWVSNMSYCFTVSAAWYIFNKRTGLSPLAPGQWKPFLAIYAGFYVFNNFIRPARFALSIGVGRYFERFVNMVQKKFRVSKGVAIFLTVFLANIVGTTTLMCAGIWLAATLSGVPIFVPKP